MLGDRQYPWSEWSSLQLNCERWSSPLTVRRSFSFHPFVSGQEFFRFRVINNAFAAKSAQGKPYSDLNCRRTGVQGLRGCRLHFTSQLSGWIFSAEFNPLKKWRATGYRISLLVWGIYYFCFQFRDMSVMEFTIEIWPISDQLFKLNSRKGHICRGWSRQEHRNISAPDMVSDRLNRCGKCNNTNVCNSILKYQDSVPWRINKAFYSGFLWFEILKRFLYWFLA